MLNTLNNPYLTLTAFIVITALTIAAWPYGSPYSAQDRQAMDALIATVTAPTTNAEKILYLYGKD